MKTVILAGGFGTRISEESVNRPKPMIEIGGMPILWHIMKEYGSFGYTEFVICAGYKQNYIKQWFSTYFLFSSDVTFDYSNGNEVIVHHSHTEPWRVTIVDTGLYTMTGGRIRRIKEYTEGERFFMTYGDGVCDVNIHDLLDFHIKHGKIATLTSVIQNQQKGILDIGEGGTVKSFREKQKFDGTSINAGYMVLEPEVFDYLEGDQTVFETTPLERLAEDGQLMSYSHKGFWQCMDSVREKMLLEKLWDKGEAPWKNW